MAISARHTVILFGICFLATVVWLAYSGAWRAATHLPAKPTGGLAAILRNQQESAAVGVGHVLEQNTSGDGHESAGVPAQKAPELPLKPEHQTEQKEVQQQQVQQQQLQQQQVQQQQQEPVKLRLPLVEPPATPGQGATRDERLYALLIANGVTSVRALKNLDRSSVAALTSRLGMDADTMSRIFGMMYAYRGNFHRKLYDFVLEPSACSAEFRGAIAFVFSLSSERADRDRVRSTWVAQLLSLSAGKQGQAAAGGSPGEPPNRLPVRVLFIMGRVGGASANATAAMVADEARQHGDLLVADFEEDYHNLTIKSLLMMRWTLSRCGAARLLIKVDADVQVVPGNFLAALEKDCAPARRSFLGWVSRYDPVHRDSSSKWYVPKAVYSPDMYPPFAHGPCYVVTIDLIEDLLRAANQLDYLHLEDVFVSAVCVQHVSDARLVPIPDFVTWDCGNRRTAVYHGVRC